MAASAFTHWAQGPPSLTRPQVLPSHECFAPKSAQLRSARRLLSEGIYCSFTWRLSLLFFRFRFTRQSSGRPSWPSALEAWTQNTATTSHKAVFRIQSEVTSLAGKAKAGRWGPACTAVRSSLHAPVCTVPWQVHFVQKLPTWILSAWYHQFLGPIISLIK